MSVFYERERERELKILSKKHLGLRWLFILLVFVTGTFLLAGKAEAATYFVDNTLVTGANDGSSWPNAFRSVKDIENALVVDNYDTIYIKATGVPFHEFLGNAKFGNKTVYGDAVGGTGTETTRGTAKAEFWSYADMTSYTWAQQGSSNVYNFYNKTPNGYDYFSFKSNTIKAWYSNPVSGSADILNSSCPSPITNLALNTICYIYGSQNVYINIGADPGGKHIEIFQDHPLEIWTNEHLYGVKGKYGTYGLSNGGCSNWIIEGVELSNNGFGTNANASDVNTSSYFRNNSIHDNSSYGVNIAGSYIYNTHFQNNLIYNNGGSGIYSRASFDAGSTASGYIENNTIYGNTGSGIYINGLMSDPEPNIWIVKNNIVFGNTSSQLNLVSGYTYTLTASNNIVGTVNKYGGIWATYNGGSAITTDIALDPLMVSPASPNFNFKLQATSPAKDAGATISSITADYLGTAIPRDSGPDIGAYEYDVTAPILSSPSTIASLANDNTPNFTFTTDEAGTILYAGDCSSSATSTTVGANTITFSTLSDGVHSNCKLSVIDPAGNDSATTSISSFTVDATAPTGGSFAINNSTTLTNSVAVSLSITCPTDTWATVQMAFGNTAAPTNWTNCATTQAHTLASVDGSRTVYVRFKDGGGNTTSDLTHSITLDTTPPTLTETTAISTPTTNLTPSYVFSSSESGTLLYTGSCTPSSSTSISLGSNTVTFSTLSDGTYTNCSLSVVDSAGNDSATTTLSSFTIDNCELQNSLFLHFHTKIHTGAVRRLCV